MIALINIAVNIYIIRYRFLRAIEGGSSRQLQNFRVYIEYVLCAFNICVSLINIYESSAYAVNKANVYMWPRQVEAFSSLLIWFRPIYFLQLNDDVAPYVVIFRKEIFSIRYFVPILLMIIFSFAVSFYLLG